MHRGDCSATSPSSTRRPLTPNRSDKIPADPETVVVEGLVDTIPGPTALGDEPAAIAGQLAQLPEQARRNVAQQGEAELQMRASHRLSLVSVFLPRIWRTCWACSRLCADAGLFQRLERRLPVDPGALHRGGGDVVSPEPIGHRAQTVR